MLKSRLALFNVKKEWVNASDYNLKADGTPFPGAGVSASRSIHAALATVEEAKITPIKMPSDIFKTNDAVSTKSDLAGILRPSYVISVDRHTWELFASVKMMTTFLRKRLFVLVKHDPRPRPSRKKKMSKA